MNRCMIALDMQNYFRPAQGVVHNISQLAQTMPTAATVFQYDDAQASLRGKAGHNGPMNDASLITTQNIFTRQGYLLPQELLNWVAMQNVEEVLLTGGHTDANVLAAGFCLHEVGIRPAIIPMLCYGNDWYMHTVTTGIWEQELGKVYESSHELKVA